MNEAPALIPELNITDFKKSLDFYCNLCGFEILYDRPKENFAMLQREGARIMIEAPTGENRIWKVGDMEYPFGRGINFQIKISEVDHLYNSLKENGYPLFLEIEEKWYRKNDQEVGNRQFLVQDPDGYLLRFYKSLGTRSKP